MLSCRVLGGGVSLHMPTHVFRMMALKPVIAVLRQVSSDGDWPVATLRDFLSELVAYVLMSS
mgnify:CR=1 FL=1